MQGKLMHNYEEFARLLDQHLYARERSAAWLAKRLGVNASTVHRWRSGEIRPKSPEVVAKIADILAVYNKSERQKLVTAAGYAYQEQASNVSHEKAEADSLREAERKENVANILIPPPPPQGIVGREDMLREVMALLEFDHSNARDVAPVALQGMGGIGKTTLAIALARHKLVGKLYPDGVLWTSLGPKPTIRNLLNEWGKRLGLDLAPELNETNCKNLLQAALYQKQVLLIIDDVWEPAHGRFFTIAGPGCRTLITTREPPIAYALATRERTKQVDVLNEVAALELLSHLAPDAVQGDSDSAKRLCERLERLPLALTLAGRLLANEADVPSQMQRLLDELIERRQARLKLLQDEGRLGLDEDNPVSLQAILGMSVDRLNKVEKKRFARLSVFGAEPLTWRIDAVAHVWQCSLRVAEATVSRFIQRGLVVHRTEQQDYWMHQLLADYATELREAMGV